MSENTGPVQYKYLRHPQGQRSEQMMVPFGGGGMAAP